MPTLVVNGTKLPVRLVEVELSKLRLDPENPRLHSAYLTHDLPSAPSQKQIEEALARLPEFATLVDALARNQGCFHAPLITDDLRVLEGNRRVAAMRRVHAEHPKTARWHKLTVQQIVGAVAPALERAIRAKYHLENALPWDGLSQLTEYTALAEREGADRLAHLLGRSRTQVEPVLVAGRCLAAFSAQHPESRAPSALWVLAGLCGVKQIEPQVAISRTTRFIYSDQDHERPQRQPYPTSRFYQWVAEQRFTRPHQEATTSFQIKPAQVPAAFRRVREAGDEALAYFLEPDGGLAKAIALLERNDPTPYWQHQRAIQLTRKYIDLLSQMSVIHREASPDLYRDATTAYLRLEQLLGLDRKEKPRVHASGH
jgi:hypothetical protein